MPEDRPEPDLDSGLASGLPAFDHASQLVIDHLRTSVPMGFWSVSRLLDGRQVYLHVHDDVYGQEPGGSRTWSESLCRHMVVGETPQIAPRAMSIPRYAAAGLAQDLPIGAYLGTPIRDGDGGLFGTLLGLDPLPRPDELVVHSPLLHLLAALLGQVLQADRLRAEESHQELMHRQRPFHDPVTGLANRALLRDRLSHATALQRRDLRIISVLVIELDGIQRVDDDLGQAAAGNVLMAVAKRLRGCLRAGDTAARLGKEKFAVLIEDGGQVAVVARKLVDRLQEPFTVEDTTVSLTACIGAVEVAPFAASPDPDTILSQADTARYAAKRAGSGRFEVHCSRLMPLDAPAPKVAPGTPQPR